MSSALRVLISEGQNHLVDVEDCFPATVSLLRTVEGGKRVLAEERVIHLSKHESQSHRQAAADGGARLLLLINAFQTFGYRCHRFSLSMAEASLPPSTCFRNSLCTGYVGFKGFGAGVFWHQ